MDKLSYALGLGIGQQLKQMGLQENLVIEDFAASIKDVLADNDLKVSHQEGQQIVNNFFRELEQKQNAAKAEAGKAAKAEGEKFLAENAKKDGINVTKSGLQYEVLNEGTGKKPKATDTVRCHYEGRLLDGTVFDSSEGKEPLTYTVGQMSLIPGWEEGVKGQPEGSQLQLVIPSALAYGPRGNGRVIPPYSPLVFDLEIVSVK